VERLITSYRENDLGGAFLDVTSILTLERLRFDLRATLTAKFGRFKIGDDGQAYAPGTDVITPNGMRAEIIALYAGWVEQGWCEGSDDFAASLIVERDPNDPTRMNISTQPNIANALRVVGALVSLSL
jgi:phage tail sheath gpL-like